jgi:hypothetical protein
LILSDLIKLLETNKHGLAFFKDKVKKVFKSQKDDLKTSRRLVYDKVQKYM